VPEAAIRWNVRSGCVKRATISSESAERIVVEDFCIAKIPEGDFD
jgi:hypothetical protein